MKGKFIVIEGGEGAGKTSQIERLKKLVADGGFADHGEFVFTREPGGSPYAEEIRSLILKSPNASQADAATLFALFWGARADHMKNVIIPAVRAGKHVICDRFDSSTYAYQIYGGEARELESFFWKAREFFLGEYVPDTYIFLDVAPEIGLARRHAEKNGEINHFDTQTLGFHTRINLGLHEFFSTVSASSSELYRSDYVTIDASQSFDDVYVALCSAVESVTMKH